MCLTAASEYCGTTTFDVIQYLAMEHFFKCFSFTDVDLVTSNDNPIHPN